VASLVLAILAAPACGGGGGSSDEPRAFEDVLEAVEGLEGKARTDKLVELATEDGGVLNFYNTAGVDVAAAVADAFEDEYDISVASYKGSDTLPQRIIAERDAGLHGADIAEFTPLHQVVLSRAGALQAYRSASVDGLIEGAAKDEWTSDRLNVYVLARNTKLLSQADAPTSWEELADPKWRGKIGLTNSDPEFWMALRDYFVSSGKGEAEADELMDAIGRNAIFNSGGSLTRELLAAGEFELAVGLRHLINREAKEGAPIAMLAIEPGFWKSDTVAIIKEPPNPAAAILFVDWVLNEGQEVFAELEADPLRKDLLVAPTMEQVEIDMEKFDAEREEILESYDRWTRLGSQGPAGS
jgi:iron(III) transport system substrate-binding protein